MKKIVTQSRHLMVCAQMLKLAPPCTRDDPRSPVLQRIAAMLLPGQITSLEIRCSYCIRTKNFKKPRRFYNVLLSFLVALCCFILVDVNCTAAPISSMLASAVHPKLRRALPDRKSITLPHGLDNGVNQGTQRRLQQATCSPPSGGCGNGIWSFNSCECMCISPYCFDEMFQSCATVSCLCSGQFYACLC